MLLAVMLLYVGAVLCVNGLWLVGQARESDGVLQMHGREVAVLNFFTGGVGVFTAGTLIVLGAASGDLVSVRGGAYILLFAFTYLWLAVNNLISAGSHAFGWYCLFVAITAVAAGYQTLRTMPEGSDASLYLGINWLLWAVLWFLFFLLLALDRPIAKFVGILTVLEAIATAWVFGLLLLEGLITF